MNRMLRQDPQAWIVRLPYATCSHNVKYRSWGMDQVAQGLRYDMQDWLNERSNNWDYWLADGGMINFYFENRGLAGLFFFTWENVDSIFDNKPVPRRE